MEKINLDAFDSEDLGPDFSKDDYVEEEFNVSSSILESQKSQIGPDDEKDFQGMQDNLEKAKHNPEKLKLYHVSDIHYEIGDIIEGQSHNHQFENVVFLTNSPKPHYTLEDKNLKNAFIYRVVPLEGVKGGRFWDELASKKVKVVERVGNAKGFINKKDFSRVKIRDFDQSAYEKVSEFFKAPDNKNLAGKDLLKKIQEKHGKSKY